MRKILISAAPLLLAMLAVFSCTEEKLIPDGADIYCSEQAAYQCEGDDLKICGADGSWAFQSCQSICESLALSYLGSCDFDGDRGHDFCECGSDCCTEGQQLCEGEDLLVCRNCGWETISCENYCDRYERQSEGCGRDPLLSTDACLCEGASSYCSSNYVKCRESHVNVCDPQGSWNAAGCRQACEKQGYSFSYCEIDLDGSEETCHCSNNEESAGCRSTQPTCKGEAIATCVNNAAELIDCEEECDRLGLDYLGCFEDEDRGHDACFCSEPEVDKTDGKEDGDGKEEKE